MGIGDDLEKIFAQEIEQKDQDWTRKIVDGVRSQDRKQFLRGLEEYSQWMQDSENTATISWNIVRIMSELRKKVTG